MDENNILHTSISDISLMTKLMAVRHKTKKHTILKIASTIIQLL
jgi:hypothetical protein